MFDEPTLDDLIREIKSRDSLIKIEEIAAIQTLKSSSFSMNLFDKALDELEQHENADVRDAANRIKSDLTLSRFLSTKHSFEDLIEHLEDDWWRIRKESLELLAHTYGEKALDKLINHFKIEVDSHVKQHIIKLISNWSHPDARETLILAQKDEHKGVRNLAKVFADKLTTGFFKEKDIENCKYVWNTDDETIKKYHDKGDIVSIEFRYDVPIKTSGRFTSFQDKVGDLILRAISAMPTEPGPFLKFYESYSILEQLIEKGEKLAIPVFIQITSLYNEIYQKNIVEQYTKRINIPYFYKDYFPYAYEPTPLQTLRNFKPKEQLTQEEYDYIFNLLEEDDLETNLMAISVLSALEKERVIQPIFKWIRKEIPLNRILLDTWCYDIKFALIDLEISKEFFFEFLNEPSWFLHIFDFYESTDSFIDEALSDERYRNLAAVAFAEYDDDRIEEILHQALEDDNKRVRWKAALELPKSNPQVLKVLNEALCNQDSNLHKLDRDLRRRAIESLLYFEGRIEKNPLFEALSSTNRNARIRAAIILGDYHWSKISGSGEGREREIQKSVICLIEGLEDDEEEIRKRCAVLLGEFGELKNQRVEEILLEIIGSNELYEMNRYGSKQYPFLKLKASIILARNGYPESLPVLIEAFNISELYRFPSLRVYSFGHLAIESLGQLGNPLAIDCLIDQLNDWEHESDFPENVLDALVKIGDPIIIDRLSEISADLPTHNIFIYEKKKNQLDDTIDKITEINLNKK
ncbi:MAG: HEAT repeat domain-containing protein [Candidatus Heimdallarchaeaceae archaeon]